MKLYAGVLNTLHYCCSGTEVQGAAVDPELSYASSLSPTQDTSPSNALTVESRQGGGDGDGEVTASNWCEGSLVVSVLEGRGLVSTAGTGLPLSTCAGVRSYPVAGHV